MEVAVRFVIICLEVMNVPVKVVLFYFQMKRTAKMWMNALRSQAFVAQLCARTRQGPLNANALKVTDTTPHQSLVKMWMNALRTCVLNFVSITLEVILVTVMGRKDSDLPKIRGVVRLFQCAFP